MAVSSLVLSGPGLAKVGQTVQFTAQVRDPAGDPVEGVPVRLFVESGPDSSAAVTCAPVSCATDPAGSVRFTYVGQAPGTDSLVAWADADFDGAWTPNDVSASRSITWSDASAPCQDAYFVSAVGSGQVVDGDRPDVSPQTARVYDGFRDTIEASRTYTFLQVQYPAPSVNVITEGLDHGSWAKRYKRLVKVNLPTYLAQEHLGVVDLRRIVAGIISDCAQAETQPRIFLAGYSQGAMVVHDYLVEITSGGGGGGGGFRGSAAGRAVDPRALISGVALIADPELMPRTEALSLGGSKPEDYGGCHLLDNLPGDLSCVPGSKAVDIPRRFQSKTWELCYSGDVICATSTVLKVRSKSGFKKWISKATDTHTKKYQKGSEAFTIGMGFGRRA